MGKICPDCRQAGTQENISYTSSVSAFRRQRQQTSEASLVQPNQGYIPCLVGRDRGKDALLSSYMFFDENV